MRQFRITIVLALAACVCATTAATAMGQKVFRATRMPKPISEVEPGKTAGNNVGQQEFKFGPFHILCEKAHSTGIVDKETFKDFAIQIKFGKCLTEAHFGTFTGGLRTTFNEGKAVGFVYHINGFAEVGNAPEGTEVTISGGEANFKISGKICKINWPSQTVPAKAEKDPEGEFSAAVYSNQDFANESIKKFPSGLQRKLNIANEFKGMAWEYEEGQCVGEGGFEEEASKTEGKTARYTGTLLEEVKGGNLEIAEVEDEV
jgi:hypothetical protein